MRRMPPSFTALLPSPSFTPDDSVHAVKAMAITIATAMIGRCQRSSLLRSRVAHACPGDPRSLVLAAPWADQHDDRLDGRGALGGGGALGRNRTCDTRFRKPVLYPLSYAGKSQKVNSTCNDWRDIRR